MLLDLLESLVFSTKFGLLPVSEADFKKKLKFG
jgi:hypothetical protein